MNRASQKKLPKELCFAVFRCTTVSAWTQAKDHKHQEQLHVIQTTNDLNPPWYSYLYNFINDTLHSSYIVYKCNLKINC